MWLLPSGPVYPDEGRPPGLPRWPLRAVAAPPSREGSERFVAVARQVPSIIAVAGPTAPRLSATAMGGFSAWARRGARRAGAAEAEAALVIASLPIRMIARAEAPLPMPDRARLTDRLGMLDESLLDPYGQNTLKGDRPIYGDDWYLSIGLEAETTFESGRIALAPGGPERAVRIGQVLSPSIALVRGNTAFRPPDWQLRARAAFATTSTESLAAGALGERPDGGARSDVGVDELYIERHLRNISDRYDFQSVRVGIQPFITDFRGFLLDDRQPAVRWFGNAQNNRLQYNVVWMRRLEKDRVTRLNTSRLRDEDIVAANLYLQDAPWLGFQVQGTALYHRDRDASRAPAIAGLSADASRPHEHDVLYVGASGDGHVGRVNLTLSGYTALGREAGGVFGASSRRVAAYFGALEASVDFDWYRLKAFALFASGDSDPTDDRSGAFDFVRDRPTFAGLEESFFQRESLPLTFGRGDAALLLTSRDGLLPSLRDPRDRDTSSFVHPGLRLGGVGADFDVLPELRLRLHATYLDFDDTAPLAALRGSDVARHIGEDYSLALVYRPWFTNNVILHGSAAAFRPGDGFADLLGDRKNGRDTLYSARLRLVLSY